MAVATMDNRVATPNEILRFVHCARCLEELPRRQSPKSFARLSVGITKNGLQVWCARHEINVALFEWAEPSDREKNPTPLKLSCEGCKE